MNGRRWSTSAGTSPGSDVMQPMEAIAEREIQPEPELSTMERAIGIEAGRRAYRVKNPPRSPRQATARTAFAVVRACRPGQWFKNALVVLAPAAAGAFTRGGAATNAWVAAIAFCFLSGAVALFNDARGRGSRRKQPRTVDGNWVTRTQLLRVAAALTGAGLLCATVTSPVLGALTLCFLVATLSHPARIRRASFAETLALTGGLIVRSAAGDIAASAPIQISFLLLVCACALAVQAIRHRATLAGRRRPLGQGRARARRIAALAVALLVGFAFISFAAAMSASSNTPLGVRAVEWLRGNGAAWLVAEQ